MASPKFLSAFLSSFLLAAASPAFPEEGKKPSLEELLKKGRREIVVLDPDFIVSHQDSEPDPRQRLGNNPLGLQEGYNYSPEALSQYQQQRDYCLNFSRRQNFCLLVDKAAHEMALYFDGQVVQTYPIELGFNPYDDKKREGDGCTPEGIYQIDFVHPNSVFYQALRLNYPNSQDRQEYQQLLKERKIPPSSSIGGEIEIHGFGSGKGKEGTDWSAGCISLSNPDLDDLYEKLGLAGFKRMSQPELAKKLAAIKVVIIKYGARDSYL